jgi:c-di-GMP phosphodiesterase
MLKKITYKKLILRIILIVLTSTLSIAFVYAQIIKKDAIEKLSKEDARKNTQLVFESLYSAMSRGWTRDDLESIVKRINKIDKNMIVDIYRSEEVVKEYGEIEKDLEARKNNIHIKKALENNEVLNMLDNSNIQYFYPIVAKQECLHCHTKTKTGEVLGVIDIVYPINDLKVSLSYIINFFILFIILFSFVIFIALFFEFDKHLVKPIKNFIKDINIISKSKDITKRISIHNNIEEINSMQEVFNNMLNSLEYQFYNDSLTYLPNRKRLLETILDTKNAILMILNIDGFQQINGLYGDKIGNDILKNTANILKQNISPNAILYKLHADEYALYYETSFAYEEIDALALHLTHVVENDTFLANDLEIFINITIGVAYGNNFLLNNADIALKLAKRKRKKYLIYETSMNIEHEYEQNLKWAKKIKDAIADDRIEPLFQAIVNTQTKEIVKYEALIRLIDENGEYIAPIHFLELAKKNKLYLQLTKIMIEKTFEKFKNSKYQFSINLSVQDILNKSVYETIFEKLKKYNLGNRVVFEIIESEGIENFKEVLEFIKEVKVFGAKISIDDFGTGYSNFEYLMKLKVDYIKIDASMIKDIDTNVNSQLVTETIVDFANKMGIETIAEFIHSESVYQMAKKMGINYSQGYYFGKPQKLN